MPRFTVVGARTMEKLDDMRAALLFLEAEMRALGWWQSESPTAEALQSSEPFCVDHLTFSEWLQWVYIPKMHAFMEAHAALPAASGLRSIAEEAWKGSREDVRRLFRVVMALDALVADNRAPLQALLNEQTRH